MCGSGGGSGVIKLALGPGRESRRRRSVGLGFAALLAVAVVGCAAEASPADQAAIRSEAAAVTEGAPGDWTPGPPPARLTTTTEAPTTTTTEAPTTTTTTVPPTTTTTAPPEDPEVANARRSAEQYIDLMPFSHAGLIEQLEFEGYPTSAATAAADSIGAVDSAIWYAQAIRSAEQYVELMPFSHSGLVDQLVFEGYSPAEAEHGATAVLG